MSKSRVAIVRTRPETVREDYHRVTDSPAKINSEKESRILRLLYYFGREIGDAPARPKWDEESRRLIVEE